MTSEQPTCSISYKTRGGKVRTFTIKGARGGEDQCSMAGLVMLIAGNSITRPLFTQALRDAILAGVASPWHFHAFTNGKRTQFTLEWDFPGGYEQLSGSRVLSTGPK